MPDGTTLPPTPVPTDAARSGAAGDACARPLVEQHLDALGELVGIGLKIARGIERAVDGEGEEAPSLHDLNAAAMAYARVARAVRQTVMLQSRLQEARSAAASRAGDLKARVAGIVRQAIEDEFGEDGNGESEAVERLAAEAAERLEQERFDEGPARPVGEIVAGICADLGLDPDWRGLARDIAAAEAFARGEAAADPEEDEGPIEVCWIGQDGKPEPVATMFPNRYRPGARREGYFDPAYDPALRRDLRREDTS
jgi:hypothetical protein